MTFCVQRDKRVSLCLTSHQQLSSYEDFATEWGLIQHTGVVRDNYTRAAQQHDKHN